MSLTLEKLSQHAIQLQKQFEAASSMMHQAAGALNFVNSQIRELQAKNEEKKDEQIDG